MVPATTTAGGKSDGELALSKFPHCLLEPSLFKMLME